MDRKNKAESYWNFFNFLRGQMSASDMRVAALLTGIAMEKCEIRPDLETNRTSSKSCATPQRTWVLEESSTRVNKMLLWAIPSIKQADTA